MCPNMGLCECVHAGVFVSVCACRCVWECVQMLHTYMCVCVCVCGGHGMGVPCHSLLHLTAKYVHKMD